jgi:hypothetical protein
VHVAARNCAGATGGLDSGAVLLGALCNLAASIVPSPSPGSALHWCAPELTEAAADLQWRWATDHMRCSAGPIFFTWLAQLLLPLLLVNMVYEKERGYEILSSSMPGPSVACGPMSIAASCAMWVHDCAVPAAHQSFHPSQEALHHHT